MKKSLPWIVTLLFAALIGWKAFAPPRESGRHWREFGQLPVILNGRVKPLDTVARTALLVIRDKQTLKLPDGGKLTAIEWLAEVLFAPARADDRAVFTIHDPDVLGLFGWQQDSSVHQYSYNAIAPHLAKIDQQYRLAQPVEPQLRDRFQNHIISLHNQLVLYQRLKSSLGAEGARNFTDEVAAYQKAIVPGLAAVDRQQAGQDYDRSTFDLFITLVARYRQVSEFAYFLAIPPEDPAKVALRTDWENIGTSLLGAARDRSVHEVVANYARLGDAYRTDDDTAFNAAVTDLTAWMNERYAPEMEQANHETWFNRYQPFVQAMVVYLLVGVLASISWATGPGVLGRTALMLGVLAFAVHTSGLAFRVYLQGLPPVTNLYSAAVFVGWGAAIIGLVVEAIFRNGVGSVIASVVGFTTLIIAHHQASAGDTMEMMQAVLASNFWLTVHVPTIVLGYSTTFAAGVVGIVFIVLGVFTSLLDARLTRILGKIAYGIVCFATLLSFTGTVLGGFWADFSWGRFWGWDPKENGAALIVLWNAVILHARWGGFIRERGLMIMTMFGCIITAFSFYGTNLLGVGLHTYGFTSSGFMWLMLFNVTMLGFMALGALPFSAWRSPLTAVKPPPAPAAPSGSAVRSG